jgi:hypothetical protein
MYKSHSVDVENTTKDHKVQVVVMQVDEDRYIDIDDPVTGDTLITLYPTRTEVRRLVTALLDLL